MLTSLWDGKDLNGWAQNPTDTFTVNAADGAIESTGDTRGFLYTTSTYTSYRVIYSVRQLVWLHWPTVLFFGYSTTADAMDGIQFQLPEDYGWDYRPGKNVALPVTTYGKPANLQETGVWYRCEILVSSSNGTADSAAAQLGDAAVHVMRFSDATITTAPCPFALQCHQSGVMDEYKDIYIEVNPQLSDNPPGSGLVTLVLPAPTITSAATASKSQVNLTWSINSTTQTGFEIFDSVDNVNWNLVTTTAATATSFSSTGLTPDTTYYFRMAAITANAISDYATASAATPSAPSANTPTWDHLGTNPSAPADGSGAWDTTDAFWSNGTTDSAWVNGGTNAAVFGDASGAAGTVTVAGITAPGITFDPPGSGFYTLTSGTLTLSGSAPAITANVNATIDSLVTAAGSLAMGGKGTITIASASAGGLSFNSPGSAGDALTGGTLTLAGAAPAIVANVSGTVGSIISGTGAITIVGPGTVTLPGADYTGGTAVNDGGTLTVSGGSFGSSASTITVGSDVAGTNSVATLIIAGGSATAQNVNVGTLANETGATLSITGSGSAVFSAVNNGSNSNTGGAFTVDTKGTVALGVATFDRDAGANTTTNTTAGLIINAGTVTASGVFAASSIGGRSSDINVNGGSLAITDSTAGFKLGTGAGNGALTMTGGTLSYLGADGLLAGAVTSGTSTISITGATSVATLTGITLNADNSATATSTLTLGAGATLYLGAVGLVQDAPAGSTVTVSLGAATIGATANWSCSGPMTLTGVTTFQAADSTDVPHNISVGGTLSGTGGITKTGGGTLTLSGGDSYSGPTTVVNGTLKITGSLYGSSSLTVDAGGFLDLAGGALSVAGSVTNNGIFEVSGISIPAQVGTFVNNGVLDLIDGPQTLPANFTNNGTVLDASSIKVQQATYNGSTFSLVVHGYANHTYQLQRADTLVAPVTWTNIGASQIGAGSALYFTDQSAGGSQGYYQVQVSP